MSKQIWNEESIQQLIESGTEETTSLEYKDAAFLGKAESNKKNIAKHVSAIANASGGVIIFGVSCHQESEKKHKPKDITPINCTEYKKEWLEQVITYNIQPPIKDLHIEPVELSSGDNNVIYVIEVPQSMTAHQVTAQKDFRYYERLNFQVKSMEDYRIRDVMNRATKPDVEVKFHEILKSSESSTDSHYYRLGVKLINQSHLLVNNFKLEFSFPVLKHQSRSDAISFHRLNGVTEYKKTRDLLYIVYPSQNVLFPNESKEIGNEICLDYIFDQYIYITYKDYPKIEWTLYADNMIPKKGTVNIPNCY